MSKAFRSQAPELDRVAGRWHQTPNRVLDGHLVEQPLDAQLLVKLQSTAGNQAVVQLLQQDSLTSREAALLSLQRTAGNQAVSAWLGRKGTDRQLDTFRPLKHQPVQRCGPVPCDCSPQEPLREEAISSSAGLVVQRACGLSQIGKRDSCGMSHKDFPEDANPYLFNVNCDKWASGQEDRLRKDVKRGDTVKVHGFASIEGQPQYNEYLSCARAEKAARFLIDEIGAVVLEIHAHGAVSGPRVPRRSVLVEHVKPKPKPESKPAPPKSDVCGPDIDGQLTSVLWAIRTWFDQLSPWYKHRSCQALEAPFRYSMAWDIRELYLDNTEWLRKAPFASTSPPCSVPQATGGQDVEDPGTCGNTVRIQGKCNLAGTVNYAAFGIMMSACYDFYDDAPAYKLLYKAQIPLYTERAMDTLIWAYKKIIDPDDPTPPTEFADATYERGPIGRPSTENRAHCTARCEAGAKPLSFTFIWEPYHSR